MKEKGITTLRRDNAIVKAQLIPDCSLQKYIDYKIHTDSVYKLIPHEKSNIVWSWLDVDSLTKKLKLSNFTNILKL